MSMLNKQMWDDYRIKQEERKVILDHNKNLKKYNR
jgi:hypothetical protein